MFSKRIQLFENSILKRLHLVKIKFISKVDAFKKISIHNLPQILVLYLKRFIYDKNGGIQKLMKHLDFQEDLEIAKGNFVSLKVKTT